MYLEEIILFWIIVLDWIVSFKFSIKGHLPNLLFLVSSRSKDVCSGSSESPGSGSEMVTIVTLWRLPRRLKLAFFFALPAEKTTSLVFILTNYQLALRYHQCKEMFFFYCTQTHERTQAHAHRVMYTLIYSYCVAVIHSPDSLRSAESLPVLKKHLKTSTENTSVSDDWYCGSRV